MLEAFFVKRQIRYEAVFLFTDNDFFVLNIALRLWFKLLIELA